MSLESVHLLWPQRLVCTAAAEMIGVCAEPELAIRNLTPANPFFLIGSDGIFEFMPSQSVVDMVRA